MGLPYAGGSVAMDGQQQAGGYPGSAVEGGGYNSSYSSNQPTRGGPPVRSAGIPGSSTAVAASSGSTAPGVGGGEEGSAMYGADATHSRAGGHSPSPSGRGGMHGGYGSNRQQGTAVDYPSFSPDVRITYMYLQSMD